MDLIEDLFRTKTFPEGLIMKEEKLPDSKRRFLAICLYLYYQICENSKDRS